MSEIIQLKIKTSFRPPITANEKLSYSCNAIQIQNAGNSIVMLNGLWTIYPGGAWADGSSTDVNLVEGILDVTFQPDPNNTNPQNNRLEINENYTNIHGCIKL